MATSIPSDKPMAPPPPGQVSDFSRPQSAQHFAQIVATLAVVVPFSTICVLVRLWTRASYVKRFGWDDIFAIIAMGLNAGLTVCYIEIVKAGAADVEWNIRLADWVENYQDSYGYWMAISCILFWMIFAAVKVSILLLYLRVLAATRRTLRIATWSLIALVSALAIGCTIDFLRSCSPVEKLFHHDIPGTCSMHQQLFFAHSVSSVITDILILVPPIPLIWRLALSPVRKLAMISILSFGLIVTLVGIVRTVFLSPALHTHPNHPLTGLFDGTYWGILEVNLAIAATCLPALAQLVVKIKQKSLSRGSPNIDAPGNVPAPFSGPSGWREAASNRYSSRHTRRSPTSRVLELYDIDRTCDEESHSDGWFGEKESAATSEVGSDGIRPSSS